MTGASAKPNARWEDGEVRYAEASALHADLDAYLAHGVIWVAGGKFPAPLEEFQFRLLLPNGASLTLAGQIISHTALGALIQVIGWGAEQWRQVEAASRGAPAAPVPPVVAAIPADPPPTTPVAVDPPGGPETLGEHLEGTLQNPMTLAEVAALPLKLEASPGKAAPSHLLGLVRWLGFQRATGVLTLRAASRVEIAFRSGRVLSSDRDREAVLVVASWPTCQFSFDSRPEGDLPKAKKSYGAWNFVVVLLRRWLREVEFGALKEALPAGGAPKLNARGKDLIPSLELSSLELRFIENRLVGQDSLERLYASSGLSADGIARLVTVLYLLDLIEWGEEAAPTRTEASESADAVQAVFERRSGGDHFQALGVHYSAAPSEIKTAYEAVLKDFGPDSPRRQTSPEAAERIVALARRAWTVLGDNKSRNKYRRETMKIDVEAAARLMADQAKMALAREEFARAKQLWEAALDLHQKGAYQKGLDAVEAAEREAAIKPR